MRHLYKCNVGLRIVEGPGFMQVKRLGMQDQESFCGRSGCGHGTPLAHSIVRKWRAQRLEDEERILLQERVFSTEEHLKSRLAAGGVTNQEAESLNRRIKNARAKLVSSIAQHIPQILMFATDYLLAGHMVYATGVSAGRPC